MLSFPVQNWQKALSFPAFGSRAASRITPRLYLSDYGTARNPSKLEELGITHVISVIEHIPDLPEAIIQPRRLHLPLPDLAEANMLEHFDATTAFISAALEENETNKVLVGSPF
jgi:atypical dual specificity phosphatase